jgi:uncharacterized Fe-S cluster protein YjdI/CDGSH-type Zn-finger protein
MRGAAVLANLTTTTQLADGGACIPSSSPSRRRGSVAEREYEGPGIIVHWDSARCIHSRLCVLGLPDVFDFDARPWVDAGAAPPGEVARVIDSCPSGALSYTRTDGAPNGRRGRSSGEDPAASIRSDDELGGRPPRTLGPEVGSGRPVVTPLPDGPLLVEGPFGLRRDDGTVDTVARITLCRCGRSRRQPHCDGSHGAAGFQAAGSVPPPDPVCR